MEYAPSMDYGKVVWRQQCFCLGADKRMTLVTEQVAGETVTVKGRPLSLEGMERYLENGIGVDI